MKTYSKNFYLIMLALVTFSCSEDDNLPLEPVEMEPVHVQFGMDTFYSEDTPENDVIILFSKPAVEEGTIKIKVLTDATLFFNTFPAAINNEIVLPVAKGAESVKFKFYPRNDWFIDGHKHIVFKITSVTTGFMIGSKNDLLLDLIDDELKGLPKSYETVAGGKSTKKTYEYSQDGKIAIVTFQTEISQVSNTISYIYKYDAQDRLNRIENSCGGIELFTWENGRIVQSDYMEDDVIIYSKSFLYYSDGNIENVSINERNSGNSNDAITVVTYEYLNGNISKKEVWVAENLFTWNLVSTHFYDNYTNKENPFQIYEILPNVVSQPYLPLSLRVDENGTSVSHSYTYEFNSMDKPIKRTTTGEVITYSYY